MGIDQPGFMPQKMPPFQCRNSSDQLLGMPPKPKVAPKVPKGRTAKRLQKKTASSTLQIIHFFKSFFCVQRLFLSVLATWQVTVETSRMEPLLMKTKRQRPPKRQPSRRSRCREGCPGWRFNFTSLDDEWCYDLNSHWIWYLFDTRL